MATLNELLQPISDTDPAGEDLSFSVEFDQLAEARREDDPSLAQGEWVAAIKTADWQQAEELAERLLRDRSKDLRVAGWYTEAAAKSRGPAGLNDGYALIQGLLERYWETMHPQESEDDLDERSGALSWLVARSVELVRQFPVVRSGAESFGLTDFTRALQTARAIERDPDLADRLEPGQMTPQRWAKVQAQTSPDMLRALKRDTDTLDATLKSLALVADVRLGDLAPSFGPLRETITELRDLVARVSNERGIAVTAPASTPPSPQADGTAAAPVHVAVTAIDGPVHSRAQALQMLRAVAQYFRTTEPHSPVTYLADKASRWAEMPLHVWLRQVVKDEASLKHLDELLGLAQGENQESES